jgi:hypothetical protein
VDFIVPFTQFRFPGALTNLSFYGNLEARKKMPFDNAFQQGGTCFQCGLLTPLLGADLLSVFHFFCWKPLEAPLPSDCLQICRQPGGNGQKLFPKSLD